MPANSEQDVRRPEAAGFNPSFGNNQLEDRLYYNGRVTDETHIVLITYNKDSMRRFEGVRFSDIVSKIDNDNMNWLVVEGLHDTAVVREICEHFKVNFLLAQDVLNHRHAPKIEEYRDYNFVIMKLFDYEVRKGKLQTIQVSIVQGRNFVLSFSEQQHGLFKNISHAIGKNILSVREKTSDYLLCLQMNGILGNYASVVEKLAQQLDEIENRLTASHLPDNRLGADLHRLRRRYMILRKAVLPLKEQYLKVFQSDSALFNHDNRIYFNDVNDHLRLLSQDLDTYREILSSLFDLFLSNNEIYMNSIMKKLTIVSTIFIPLTFLAGIWGMNFTNMPELSWKYGYLFAWLLLIVLGVSIFVYFRWRKWF